MDYSETNVKAAQPAENDAAAVGTAENNALQRRVTENNDSQKRVTEDNSAAAAAGEDGETAKQTADAGKKRLCDMTIAAYTAALSSASPVPGGGGTAACAAALGAALGAMVAYLTVGKKKYAAVEEEMKTNIANFERLEKEFLGMMDRDAEAFAPLAAAYGLPRNTAEEKQEREIIMEQCLRAAAEAPLGVMRASAETVSLLENAARNGSRMAISDAGVGASLVKAALQSAALNVFINTKSMKDRDRAKEINTETREILEEYGKRADAVYSLVYDSLTEQ